MRPIKWTFSMMISLGLALGVAACGGGQTPPPAPPSQPQAKATPPVATAATPPKPTPTAAPTTATNVEPPVGKYTTEVVVHQAEIHGKVKSKAGKKLLIEPLVATSQTVPQKGNKAEVFRVVGKDGAESDWLLVAEGEVGETWAQGKNLEVTVHDEKDAPLDGKKAFHFAPGTMVRLRWQW
ncbi:hypothetical protein [Polyangium jinanense]|uniref:Lipoprotein n=1 Tax=Polyangium jinanense TaxID=2829994 RepID=A0A9X3XDX9_9BACT|nr:hypothetical protein [Polyangium jinanense]MDC3962141.1 hypothetical protein [Polyangium jinanense]MDC3988854.1 hypothetical protein [Polyangium jinanense]